jgi:hypothetical protein
MILVVEGLYVLFFVGQLCFADPPQPALSFVRCRYCLLFLCCLKLTEINYKGDKIITHVERILLPTQYAVPCFPKEISG